MPPPLTGASGSPPRVSSELSPSAAMEDSGNAPIPAQGDASRDSRGSLAASAVTEVASVPPLVSSSRTFFDIIGEAVGVADELPPVDSNPTPPARSSCWP